MLQVQGLSCASCVAAVEAALSRVPGVLHAAVNLATCQVCMLRQLDVHALSHLAQSVAWPPACTWSLTTHIVEISQA